MENKQITGNELAMPQVSTSHKYGTTNGERYDYGHVSSHGGLTIRQHFAALAMQGLISKYNLKTPEDQEIICQLSVELADTLIAELNK